jgi:small subunit ribosomal protein S15
MSNMIFKNRKKQQKLQQYVTPFQTHEGDVGSAQVQIARLTLRINDLSTHMRQNKKDNHSLLGLKKMSSKRKKFLKFLQRTNIEEYNNIITQLSLRHS